MVELADAQDFGDVTSVKDFYRTGDQFMADYLEAHRFSNNIIERLKQDSICGCFYCGKIFDPVEITEWIIADNNCDREGTAICPYCGIDSVIGASSGFPITNIFLDKMNRYWFG